MATTSRPIEVLKLTGVRDSSGNVVASGKARFYDPGTLVAATVYSDAACSTAITPPLTLNSQGQGTVYCLAPVRMIVKDSTETTTYYDDIPALVRANWVYVTNSAVNGGVETTLDAALSEITTSYQWLDTATATERDYDVVIGERLVSVKDFGATGDGTTDDTDAIQDATDTAAGRVYFPPGTYKITAAITTANGQAHHWFGAGRAYSIIKNFGTTTRAFDLTADNDHRYVISDLSISANTASSAAAIYSPSAGSEGVTVERVTITGHESGIAIGTWGRVRDCHVTYTGTDAADRGVDLTDHGLVESCIVVGPGTGGSDTGIFIQSQGVALRCRVSSAKNGFTIGSGASARATGVGLTAASCAVGFNVPAGTTIVRLIGCDDSSNTTGLTIGANVDDFSTVGCSIATYSGTPASYRDPATKAIVTAATSAAASPTWTPDVTNGSVHQRFIGTYAAGNQAVTVAAPTSLATLQEGTFVYFQICKTGANDINLTWDAIYLSADSTAFAGCATVATVTERTIIFSKVGGNLRSVMIGDAAAV